MTLEELIDAVTLIKKEDYELFKILKNHLERLKNSFQK